MSETDKILGFDQLRNLQFQVADLKTELAEAIRQRTEVDHWHLRKSLEQLSAAASFEGTGDLKWDIDYLSRVLHLKSIT
jgi:hypothetical protein